MKKISISSLLFALLACNQLSIKAETSKLNSLLISAHSLSIATFGIFGLLCFKECWEFACMSSNNATLAHEGEIYPIKAAGNANSQRADVQALRDGARDTAKGAQLVVAVEAIKGAACLTIAGYSAFHLYKAVKQAKR
jgi:hypothetical protein